MEKHKVSVGSILLGVNLIVVIFFFSLYVANIFRNFHVEEVLMLFQTGQALESLVGKVQDLIKLVVFILPYLAPVVAIKLKKRLGYSLACAACFAWCFLPIYDLIAHGSSISITPSDIIGYLQTGVMLFFIPAISGVYCAIACTKSAFQAEH
jgi:hypothetical protein